MLIKPRIFVFHKPAQHTYLYKTKSSLLICTTHRLVCLCVCVCVCVCDSPAAVSVSVLVPVWAWPSLPLPSECHTGVIATHTASLSSTLHTWLRRAAPSLGRLYTRAMYTNIHVPGENESHKINLIANRNKISIEHRNRNEDMQYQPSIMQRAVNEREISLT